MRMEWDVEAIVVRFAVRQLKHRGQTLVIAIKAFFQVIGSSKHSLE